MPNKQIIIQKDETEEAVTIPLNLAKLLASEPKDFKDSKRYEDVQAVAKSLLKVLLSVK